MRLESTSRPDQYKCWLTDAELEDLRRAAADHRDDLVIQLGGYVGLRAFEISQVIPAHVKRTEDGEHYRLRVPGGKDTSGNGGKPRDAYLPPDVEGAIHRYQSAEGIARQNPLIDLSESGVGWWSNAPPSERLSKQARRTFATSAVTISDGGSRSGCS